MSEYKLLPPPKGTSSLRQDEKEINDQDMNKQQINVDDNYLQTLQEIQNGFAEGNFVLLINEMRNFCEYLDSKKISGKIPFLEQYQTIDIIVNLCNSPQINANIQFLDLIFHIMYIITQEPYYCTIISFDLVVSFLDLEFLYHSSDWYFKLLSNYVLQSYTFKTFSIYPIFNHIQNPVLNHDRVLNVLKFLEIFSKYKFIDENTDIDPNYLSETSFVLNLIINYCSSLEDECNIPKSPLVKSISIILERITRKHQLNLTNFEALGIPHFIRSNFQYFPKLVKMIGFYVYYYGAFEADFLMVAYATFDINFDLNNYKYSLWTLYNLIQLDSTVLYKYDSPKFIAIDQICSFLYEKIDSLHFLVKKQAILLIALIYSRIPQEKIRNEDNLETALELFLQFSEDEEDITMLENILSALLNINKYFQISNQKINPKITSLFNNCKESLMQTYLIMDPNCYQLLQTMN